MEVEGPACTRPLQLYSLVQTRRGPFLKPGGKNIPTFLNCRNRVLDFKRFHYGTTRSQNRNRRFEDVEHYQITGSSGTHAPLWSSSDFREVTNFRGHSSLEHPEAFIPASPAPAPGLRGAWASASPHRQWGERPWGSQSPPAEATRRARRTLTARRGGLGSAGAPRPPARPRWATASARLGPAASLGFPHRVLTTRLSRFPMVTG